jgi:DNA polymerase-3 subunit epsilon
MRRHAQAQRFEDAARLRDRVAALERVARELAELDRLRALEVCILVPASEDGFVRAYLVRGGRIAAVRTLPAGAGGRLEAETAVAAALRADAIPADPEDVEELLLVGSFLRRPPPELVVVPLRADRILAA